MLLPLKLQDQFHLLNTNIFLSLSGSRRGKWSSFRTCLFPWKCMTACHRISNHISAFLLWSGLLFAVPLDWGYCLLYDLDTHEGVCYISFWRNIWCMSLANFMSFYTRHQHYVIDFTEPAFSQPWLLVHKSTGCCRNLVKAGNQRRWAVIRFVSSVIYIMNIWWRAQKRFFCHFWSSFFWKGRRTLFFPHVQMT